MALLQLRSEDARIVYLATIYHLGRPGSETHPDTLQKHDMGLQPIHDEILPRLNQAVVEIDASPYQVIKIGEALAGVGNELKAFALSNGRSMVPRFTATVHDLYPETVEEPSAAMDLVQHPVMLRNRLSYALEQAQREIAEAQAQSEADRRARKRWWQVWRS